MVIDNYPHFSRVTDLVSLKGKSYIDPIPQDLAYICISHIR